jgi:polyether ionophore transport system permease protein
MGAAGGSAVAGRRRIPPARRRGGPGGRAVPTGWRGSPTVAVARRAFRDARIRTIAFAYLFAAVCYINPVAYRHTYPTLHDRLEFAHSFGTNKAVVLFYGHAFNLLSAGGYTAWRSGGTLTIFAAVFGVLAAVRALRTEEDTGRAELVLSGIVGRGKVYAASIVAILGQTAVLWVGSFIGLLLAGLGAGGSAYLALEIALVVPVFAGVGALASQLAPTRRMALELGSTAIGLAFLVRVIADTSSGLHWLRWVTPLGWAEEMRPFTGAEPVAVLLPLAAATILLYAASRIYARRDLGSGILAARDTAPPRLQLLSSPTAQALRGERMGLLIWLLSVGAFSLIIGVISKSISSAGISKQLQQELEKLGTGSVLTPKGYISFSFIFFSLAVSLFMCAQIGAARHEEADQQLETLLALPVSRREWFGGRLGLAVIGALAISLVAGALAWVGAELVGVSLSFPRLLEAGINCLPVAVLFLGLAALAYAAVPRASTGIAYGLVAVAFLWQLFGSLIGAPRWLVDLTPFAHVAAVPAQSLRIGAAAAMVGIGVLAGAVAMAVFERRDVLGS